VSLLAGFRENCCIGISIKFGGKVEDGRRKKLPDPGGNLDCATSGSALLRLSFYVHTRTVSQLGCGWVIPGNTGRVLPTEFSGLTRRLLVLIKRDCSALWRRYAHTSAVLSSLLVFELQSYRCAFDTSNKYYLPALCISGYDEYGACNSTLQTSDVKHKTRHDQKQS